LIWLFLGWLGKSVGQTVTHSANGKRNKKLGILSTSAFVIGYNLGAVIAFLITSWLSYGIIISGAMLAEHIINLLNEIGNLISLITSPVGSITTIGFAYGGYNAYKTASA
jgi:hypothetical protein